MVFPSTHWTLLAMASLNGNTVGRQALEELCRRYWAPVCQFIRSRGRTEAEAEDLTQEFILHLMEQSTFKRADRLRGRFRALLLRSLVWFLADEWDKRSAAKRGGPQAPLSLNIGPGDDDPALPVEPAEAARFDQAWALTVLKSAWQRVHQEYAEAGRTEDFAVLKRFLPGAAEPPSYEAAAAQLEMTASALASEIHRMRGRFREHTRAEVARTVSAPHEIDEEMAHLRRLLEYRGTDFRTLAESQGTGILRRD